MGSSHPRATPRHGAGAASCPGGSSRGGTAVVWGCCSSVCAWIPHTPVPLQRPEGKLRHRCPADAAHPCWLQLWCPPSKRPWWSFWGWQGATWRWPLQLDTSPWGVLVWEHPLPVPAMGSSGWGQCGAGIPGVFWSPGDTAPTLLPAAAVVPGREDAHPIAPIPCHPIPPHPGCLQPLPAALSRRWPQRGRIPGFPDSRLPGRNVPGRSGPPPAGAASSFAAI